MVATTSRASSASKQKSSAHTTSSSSPLSSSSKPTKNSSTSLVQASAKKTFKNAKAGKKNNRFRDSEKRELLDGQTTQLFTQEPSRGAADKGKDADTFSYNMPSHADQRRTRKQVDEAALALDLLMKSF